MNKDTFLTMFGNKTLLHVEKDCFRKLQKVFGDYVLEIVKLYPVITLCIGKESLVFNLVEFTINGTNKNMFSSMVDMYKNHLRQAVWNSVINDFHSGKRHTLTLPLYEMEEEILKGISDGQ